MSEWEKYHRTMATLASEMIGAADYFDQHPEEATDNAIARTFRQYADRMRAVAVPA